MSGDTGRRDVQLTSADIDGCADGCGTSNTTAAAPDTDRRAVLSRRVRLLVAAIPPVAGSDGWTAQVRSLFLPPSFSTTNSYQLSYRSRLERGQYGLRASGSQLLDIAVAGGEADHVYPCFSGSSYIVRRISDENCMGVVEQMAETPSGTVLRMVDQFGAVGVVRTVPPGLEVDVPVEFEYFELDASDLS